MSSSVYVIFGSFVVLAGIQISAAQTAEFVEFEGNYLLFRPDKVSSKSDAFDRCAALCAKRVKLEKQEEYDMIVRFMQQQGIQEAFVQQKSSALQLNTNYAPGHPGAWDPSNSDSSTWIDGTDGYQWKAHGDGTVERPFICWEPQTPMGCRPQKTDGCLFREFSSSKGSDGGGNYLESHLNVPSTAHCARSCCEDLPTCQAYHAKKNGELFSCHFFDEPDYAVKGPGGASEEDSYSRLVHQ